MELKTFQTLSKHWGWGYCMVAEKWTSHAYLNKWRLGSTNSAWQA
jgi:hypothetical protein